MCQWVVLTLPKYAVLLLLLLWWNELERAILRDYSHRDASNFPGYRCSVLYEIYSTNYSPILI